MVKRLVERRILAPIDAVAAAIERTTREDVAAGADVVLAVALAMVHESVRSSLRRLLLLPTLVVAGFVALLGLTMLGSWFVLDGVARGVVLVVLVGAAAIAVLGVLLLRWASSALTATLFGRTRRVAVRAPVDRAVKRADLPTGPWSLVRMLGRVARRGPTAEAQRIVGVARELVDEVGLAELRREGVAEREGALPAPTATEVVASDETVEPRRRGSSAHE